MNQTISLLVNTFNEGRIINSCLQKMSWVDEIIVIDMGSIDETVFIVQKYTPKIYQFKKYNYVEPARNYAIIKASSDWVFILDPDEILSENGEKCVRKIINEASYDGYFFPRRTYITDSTYLKHGYFYPDYQLRLFRNNGKIRYSGKIHEQPVIPKERTKIIDEVEIYHNTSHCKYDAWIHFFRFRNYIPIEGKELADTNISAYKLLYLIPLDFIRHIYRSFIKLDGYKDGYLGFRAAVIFSMYKTCVNCYALGSKLRKFIL